jgi:hypothetical protein
MPKRAYNEAEAYDALMEVAGPLPIADTPDNAAGWLLSLDGRWFRCNIQAGGTELNIPNRLTGSVILFLTPWLALRQGVMTRPICSRLRPSAASRCHYLMNS